MRTRSAIELAAALRAGELTAFDVVREAIERVEEAAGTVGGVAAVDPERSLADAALADKRLRAGEGGVFEGVPVTVKDWIDVAGWPVIGAAGGTAGSPGRRPARDATAVARLRAAGAVVVAISSAVADNPVHGVTRNPRHPGKAPGGSSSGTAALVAAGAVPLGLGSDSGGSVRLPAAWCGVAGLKPTFGRVPLTGHFPRCGALEDGRTVIGPLASSVSDLAAVLTVIAGPDGMDAGAVPVPLGDPANVRLAGLRVATMAGAGLSIEGGVGARAEVKVAADSDGARSGAEAGAEVGALAGAESEEHEATGWAVEVLAGAGAGVADRAVADVREEALELTLRYWGRAQLSGEENVRLLWDWDRFRRRMLAATAGVDVLVMPAAEEPPSWRESATHDYLWTLPWSLTGAPVVVVPCAGSAVQVVGRPWEDHVALAVAAEIERAAALTG